jgi:quercetin dioxygenase-like cupin family protein
MPQLVPLLHGMISNRLWDLVVGVMAQLSMRSVPTLLIATFAFTLLHRATAGENRQPAVQTQTLLRASSSWDGEPYKSYPSGRPELSILKITLAPHTELEWHTHPMPNAAYVVAGELTLERKKDGKKQRFVAGQAVAETVDTFHRGMAGNELVVLIVFYAGSPGVSVVPASAPLNPCRRRDCH